MSITARCVIGTLGAAIIGAFAGIPVAHDLNLAVGPTLFGVIGFLAGGMANAATVCW